MGASVSGVLSAKQLSRGWSSRGAVVIIVRSARSDISNFRFPIGNWKLEIGNNMADFSIGVDLGGTNLRIAAVDEHGVLLEKVTLGTQVALGRDRVIHDMCEAIRHLAHKYQDSGALQGIGIGVPGIIDMKTGT